SSLLIPRPPSSPLFPYTTLFRSRRLPLSVLESGLPMTAQLPYSSKIGLMAALGSGALLLGAYYFQYVEKLAPCDLCYWQRWPHRSEEHTSELQSLRHLVCRLLLE